MKAIRFKQNHPPYNGGEIAGFPAHEAAELIAKGVAVEHDASAHHIAPKVAVPVHTLASVATRTDLLDQVESESPAPEVTEAASAEPAPRASRSRNGSR